ncbi:MAG: PQQ-binding-like beta-propeller repeat protein [Dehalococcoidia bacterium]|nr:PQQ-binding-like beta-propeller repeat protein [Dehalococcoidia bacterium]
MSSPRQVHAVHAVAGAIILLAGIFLLHTPGVFAGNPGDWPMDRHDPGNTGYSSGETALQPPLRLKWSASSSTYGASPVIAGGLVYANINGGISALDAAAGATRWTSTIAGFTTAANGFLYVGAWQSTLYALDAQTGALLWSDVFDCCIDDAAMAAGGVVYLGTRDGQVRALDGATGALKWAYNIGQGNVHFSTPSVSGGKVFLESQEAAHVGRLRALDAATGEPLWTYGSLLWSGFAPVVVDGTVYFTDGQTTVGSLDAQTGSVNWLVHPGGLFLAPPAVANGMVYLSDHWGLIDALDASTGSLKWSHQLDWPKNSFTPAPVVANGLVYVPGLLGQFSAMVALDALTGEYRWGFSGTLDPISDYLHSGNLLFTSAAVADGVLYAHRPGVLYALENAPTWQRTYLPLLPKESTGW